METGTVQYFTRPTDIRPIQNPLVPMFNVALPLLTELFGQVLLELITDEGDDDIGHFGVHRVCGVVRRDIPHKRLEYFLWRHIL